jgi:uncharacterized iron-regulated membrane protein
MAAKSALKTIHTWIGIASGVFLSVIALTGSVILFRAEFERAALPPSAIARDGSRGASLDDVAHPIARLRPDAAIRRVHMPADSGGPYILQIQSPSKRTERFAVDSTTARVLGAIQPSWVDWMVDLHRNLLAGATGRAIVGGFGITLFLLSGTGLLMWLTGARSRRAWISVRKGGIRGAVQLRTTSRRGIVGICVPCADLFYRGGPRLFEHLSRCRAGADGKAGHGPWSTKRLSLDEYVRLGRAAMPDGVPIEMRLPEGPKGPIDLRLYRAGDLAPSGNHVYLNPATDSVVTVDRIADRPIGARFLAALSPLHYAEFGGVTVKIAWALFGLVPLLLFVTGLVAWWKPARKKSPQPATAPEQEVPVG